MIDYKLRVRGIPMKWRTLISAWEPPFRFVDEQLRGPCLQWIHEHTFAERNRGTLTVDVVRYSVLGRALNDWLLVRRDVERIFEFRQRRLLEIFSSPGVAAVPARRNPV